MNYFEKYVKKAFFIREFENFLIQLFKKGELNGTVHTCVGQELTPVILSSFLKNGDRIFSNHRGHGHFISFSGDTRRLMAEMIGLTTGVSGGIGGSQHLINEGFISNGIQGGLSPIAVGYSFANKLKGNNNIAVVFIGDGTLGEGVLYEALNLASSFSTPTIFVLENNSYAQSTSAKQTIRGDIQKRIEGFGIKYLQTNIWDIKDIESKMSEAIKIARTGEPSFIEMECYRLNSHSKGDDNRNISEIENYFEKDLLNIFKKENPGITNQYLAEVQEELNNIYIDCKQGTSLKQVKKHEHLFSNEIEYKVFENIGEDLEKRINKHIYLGLKGILSEVENSILIGEDIQNKSEFTDREYGGAFKVTQDLSDLFPNKVYNTPISEAGIIGFGIGASLNNFRSIVEIMFGDFLTLGFDQILQQASKIPEMFGQKVELPLIIRTPMGGRRGYGPTHSQNIEKHFLFIPNINILAINSLISPTYIYSQINKYNKTPTIVIEDKICYTKFLDSYKIKGYKHLITNETFPTLIIEPINIKANYTYFVYGSMLDEVLDALGRLLKEDIFPRIICPTSISPLNLKPLIDSLEKANHLVFVEEGSKYGGLSSEIIAYLTEKRIHFILENRISNESIIPCAKEAERNTIPNSELILKKINL